MRERSTISRSTLSVLAYVLARSSGSAFTSASSAWIASVMSCETDGSHSGFSVNLRMSSRIRASDPIPESLLRRHHWVPPKPAPTRSDPTLEKSHTLGAASLDPVRPTAAGAVANAHNRRRRWCSRGPWPANGASPTLRRWQLLDPERPRAITIRATSTGGAPKDTADGGEADAVRRAIARASRAYY